MLYTRVICVLCIFINGFSWYAYADQKREEECNRLKPNIVSPVEMAECMSDIDESELLLKEKYSNLKDITNERDIILLERSHNDWIRFRNSNCDYEGSRIGEGTMSTSEKIFCKARMNIDRSKYYEEYIKLSR